MPTPGMLMLSVAVALVLALMLVADDEMVLVVVDVVAGNAAGGVVPAGSGGLNNPLGTFTDLELFDMAAVVVEADSGGCVGTILTIKALCGWGGLMSLAVTHVTGILNDSDLRWAVKG